MPLERQRELPLAKPLSLEQFVALMMPHPNLVRSPLFYKTDSHSINTSSDSDSVKSHAPLHEQVILDANISTYLNPNVRTVAPGNSGMTFFKSQHFSLREGICNPPV